MAQRVEWTLGLDHTHVDPYAPASFFERRRRLNFELFIRTAVFVLVPMILSLAVHEYAHAAAARLLGDDTAESQGRLTLNPLSHIDPIGTLLLPLASIFASTQAGGGFPFFGWAKPVPYNPLRFRRTVSMRWGTVLVAAAGPLSNLLFALLCTLGLYIWFRVDASDFGSIAQFIRAESPNPGVNLLWASMRVNVGLFIFNLIPIPPLDGSKVLSNLLPRRYEGIFVTLERYSFILFLLLIMTPAVRWFMYPAMKLIAGLVGFILP